MRQGHEENEALATKDAKTRHEEHEGRTATRDTKTRVMEARWNFI